jgi:hypothetical protein
MTTDQTRSDRKNTVKGNLTPNPRKRRVENDEYCAFARRVLRAYGRRIADGDIDAVIELKDLLNETEAILGRSVIGLHSLGYSWAEIGKRLGVTRQAAHERWSEASID